MSDYDSKRLDKVEQDLKGINTTLVEMGVVLKQLADVHDKLHDLDKRTSKNEYNWGIVRWVLGGSGVGLAILLLRSFGVL